MRRSSTSSIERIGVSSVQLLFEKIGYVFREQPVSDYGIDAHVEVVQDETVTGKLIAIQIKSGASWFKEATDTHVVFRSDRDHLDYWSRHALPVIVVVYDPETDVAYWESISDDKIVPTKKGWKLNIPFVQRIDQASKSAFERMVGTSIPCDEYTILSLQDTSHNGAKRYSANILVENASQQRILEISHRAIEYIRQRKYHRSDIAKQRWNDSSAHVVFLFVYTSIDDYRMTNWVSRSLWIDKALPEKFAPSRFNGTQHGDGVITEWSSNYNMLRLFSQQNTLIKEEYLEIMESHLKVMSPLIDKARDLSSDFDADALSDSEYTRKMIELERGVDECYMSSSNIGLAPFECKDVNERFQGAMAFAHNTTLPFSARGLNTWDDKNRDYLVHRALRDYEKEITRLEFELEKIR